MRENLAHAMGVAVAQIGVKATTTERLGWEGEGKGIGAWAVCLLTTIDSPEQNADKAL